MKNDENKDIRINLTEEQSKLKGTEGELTRNVDLSEIDTSDLTKEEIEALAASKAVELRENDKKLLEDQEEEKKKEEKNKKFRRVMKIIIVILFIILFMTRCSVQDVVDPVKDFINKGFATTSDIDEGEKAVEEYDARYSMLTMNMNKVPVFQNGRAKGNVNIINDPENVYVIYVDIYLVNENNKPTDLIYSSDLIPIGQRLAEDTLDVNLPAGTYPAVAYFNAVPVDDLTTVVGKGGAMIEITVLETVQ